MSVNFDKNQSELVSAWKDVLDDTTPTNWAIFGYENGTNILKLVTKGDGSLEDMTSEFTISQIQYAFCRYTFKDSVIPKFFIIHWLGEATPPSGKIACANHINDITNFFRRSSMTVVARNEDDIEVNSIVSKLEKISVKTHNLKERLITEHVSPVGTNYKRIQPQKEISSAQRETFWTKMREEEKKQKEQENLKLKQEKLVSKVVKKEIISNEKNSPGNLLKESIVKLEKTESPPKPEPVKVKTASSLVQRRIQSFTKALEDNKPPIIPDSPIKKMVDTEKENVKENDRKKTEDETKSKDNEMESNMNVKNLNLNQDCQKNNNESPVSNIAQKASLLKISEDPIVVSTTTIQKDHDHLTIETPVEQRTPSPENEENDLKPQASAEGELSDDEQNLEELEEEEEYEVNPPDSWQPDNRGHGVIPVDQPDPNFFAVKSSHLEPLEDIAEEAEESQEECEDDKNPPKPTEENYVDKVKYGLCAKALYDYEAADETEISFDPDDIICHIDKIDEGWWQGLGPNGTFGLFPANYVKLLN